MSDAETTHTAVRVALWRALHAELDAPDRATRSSRATRRLRRGTRSSSRDGFSQKHVSGAELAARYFIGRADGLRPSSGEEILVATT